MPRYYTGDGECRAFPGCDHTRHLKLTSLSEIQMTRPTDPDFWEKRRQRRQEIAERYGDS